jgi:hypothetical protein
MSRCGRSCLSVAVVLVLVLGGAAQAHVVKRSGPFRVTMGWAVEPPYSGSLNHVEVEVADSAGNPVAVPPGALDVDVTFGGARGGVAGGGAPLVSMPLFPAGARGKLSAAIIPTRPGTYAFHVTGTLRGASVDVQATCSAGTFDCVLEPVGIQFPVKEPTAGQLAERVARGLPRAERDADRADSSHTLAIAALIAAGLALAAGGIALVRARPRK